jgi:hypothetical protein
MHAVGAHAGRETTNERNAMSESTRSGGQLDLPANTVRVNLPHTEVCMHLRVAGRDHWVAPVGERAAQIYTDDGERYSAPILLCEAGLDADGRPQELLRPTCTAFTVCYRDAANYKETTRVVVADAWDADSFGSAIAPKLEEGEYFTPCQVGLPDAHIRPFDEDDHPSHTFTFGVLVGEVALTEVFAVVCEQPTLHLTWSQLCGRFRELQSFDPADWPGAAALAERDGDEGGRS